MKIGRREFTLQSALAILAGTTITISGCNSDDAPSNPTGPSPTPTPSGNINGDISANHGHVAVITSAQLMAGNAISLDITGSAGHPHTVELTAAEVMQLEAGGSVSKTSSNDDGHAHTVTFG